MRIPLVVPNSTVVLNLNISNNIRHSIKLISACEVAGGQILMSIYK